MGDISLLKYANDRKQTKGRKERKKKQIPFFSTKKKGEITEEQLLEGRMNRLNGGEYISHHKKRMPGGGKKFAHEKIYSQVEKNGHGKKK